MGVMITATLLHPGSSTPRLGAPGRDSSHEPDPA